ncbi:MAG: ABC transporter permease subunit [Anaerolineae bacterium]
MASTTLAQPAKRGLFNTRRGRILRENLTAYALLSPAMILIFLFGIFPVAFAFFVSLHRWRRFPDVYVGLSQYERGLDGFAYVLFFWLAAAALIYAIILLMRLIGQPDRMRAFSYFVPGILSAAAVLLFVNWIAIVLPIILDIPQRLRGAGGQGAFITELWASFQYPEAAAAGNQFLLIGIAALACGLVWLRLIKGAKAGTYWFWAAASVTGTAVAYLVAELTYSAVNTAVETARANGESLPIWSQIVLISVGALLIGAAYFTWNRAVKAEGNRGFVLKSLAAILLAASGVIFVTQLPQVLANADADVLKGFGITLMFVIGTVPFQLALGLFFAVLLFQNIKGKTLFRVVYFLPYIMPFVATSIVFRLIFSYRPESIANHVLNLFGIADQKWLLEPLGINTLLFGAPSGLLAGPSLALIVIMMYSVWTYIGYDAVVFLAGLGNIPSELYEAARIDGAGSWALFRSITLPLLSPTTFVLSLIAIIGTFQAFTQIWLMRTPASQGSVDTIGVYIFETARSTDPPPRYASALSFVLFGAILPPALAQNRLQGRNVFYG